MRINRNETLRILNKKNKKADINELIAKYNLNNDLYNTDNKKFINFLCFTRIKNIILLSMIISIIIGLIIFIILYHSDKNNKTKVSFKHYINNTNIDGYYIPKGNHLNGIYKKCSIDKCKRCYGNLYNDTCTSCFDSYNPIIDENNKIISCESPNVPTETYITLNETNKINFTYNPINFTNNYFTSIPTDNFIEIKTDSSIVNINNKTTEPSVETTSDKFFSSINELSNEITIYKITDLELSNETIIDNKFSTINELSNENIISDTTNLITEEFTSNISEHVSILSESFKETKTEFPLKKISEIRLVIQGNGVQKLLNDYYFHIEPSEVLVNGKKDDSCSKTCNFKDNRNNIILRFDTQIETCYSMFDGLNNIIEIDLSDFDASNSKNMSWMFNSCSNLEKIEFGNMNTSSLENIINN